MKTRKIFFPNQRGQKLAALLDLPDNEKPNFFALFTHCFTCTKNLKPMAHISHSLTSSLIGVLRFDFTGLGESQGDFSSTNFSTNLSDIYAAVTFIEKEFKAVEILLGHSLGGSAAILAAESIPSVKAVAVIAAPSKLSHLSDLLHLRDRFSKREEVDVFIGEQKFVLKKQFLEDLESTNLESMVNQLKKPLLILHSPQDNIVEWTNGLELFRMAQKASFISLEGADHLLLNKKHATYAGQMIAAWLKNYLVWPLNPEIE